MTLVETDAPARLNGAHAPPLLALPAAEPVAAAARRRPPERLHRLKTFDGSAIRVLSSVEYAALQDKAQQRIVETTRSQHDIARELDMHPGTLSKWVKRHGWQRPEGAPVKPDYFHPRTLTHETAGTRRSRMVQRLYRIFDRQTCDLEARAAAPKGRTDEKDARTLSVLAKALETLIALDRDDGASTDTPEPADREKFNEDLADRIRRWAEQGSPVEGPGQLPDATGD